jgi:hypothetical protein
MHRSTTCQTLANVTNYCCVSDAALYYCYMLLQVHRVLKPGGRFYATTVLNTVQFSLALSSSVREVFTFTPENLQEYMKKAGYVAD